MRPDSPAESYPLLPELPREVERALAERARQLRLSAGWKQSTLSERSGVTLASLRRFERTGLISLASLLKLCHALGRLDDFREILLAAPARSMAELIGRSTSRPRRRGST